eukprot:2632496-Amphidinium_carterae.1
MHSDNFMYEDVKSKAASVATISSCFCHNSQKSGQLLLVSALWVWWVSMAMVQIEQTNTCRPPPATT